MPIFRGVLLKLIDEANVDIQGIVFGVENRGNFHLHFTHTDRLESRKLANPEILVHDIVPFSELLHLFFGDPFETGTAAMPVPLEAAECLVLRIEGYARFSKNKSFVDRLERVFDACSIEREHPRSNAAAVKGL
jgi:hypothetical protein